MMVVNIAALNNVITKIPYATFKIVVLELKVRNELVNMKSL